MERVFSVDEISDPFWAPSPATAAAMNRSSSEWCFEKFLQETPVPEPSSALPPPPAQPSGASNQNSSLNISKPSRSIGKAGDDDVVEQPSAVAATVVLQQPSDPRQVAAILRQKLDSICAAVAVSRASGMMPQESSSLEDNKLQNLDYAQVGSQSSSRGGGPTGAPTSSDVQNLGVPGKSDSGSEQSDDDEVEGEAETTDNMNPADAKRVRRKLSNRESARRSRRRKQAHLSELEAQVSELGIENSSLLKRLTDINQKYSEAAVDHRILKADVETLRAKVKMAEDTVKRVTGLNPNPMYPSMSGISHISSISLPFSGSPSDATSDAAVSIPDDASSFFQNPAHVHRMNNSRLPKIGPTAPRADNNMQRAASLEDLQKWIRGGAGSSGSAQWDNRAG